MDTLMDSFPGEKEELPPEEMLDLVLKQKLIEKLEPDVVAATAYHGTFCNVAVQVGLTIGGPALKKGKHVFLLNQVKPSIIFERYTDPDVYRIVKKIRWKKKFNIGVKKHVGIFMIIDKTESYGKEEDHQYFKDIVKTCILECCESVRPLMGKSSSELQKHHIAAIRLSDPVCRRFRLKKLVCPTKRAKVPNDVDPIKAIAEMLSRARASLYNKSCSDSGGKNSSISLDKESCSDYSGKKRKLQ